MPELSSSSIPALNCHYKTNTQSRNATQGQNADIFFFAMEVLILNIRVENFGSFQSCNLLKLLFKLYSICLEKNLGINKKHQKK